MKRRGFSFIHTRVFIAIIISFGVIALVMTTGLQKNTLIAPPTPSPSSPITINDASIEARSGQQVTFLVGVRNIAAGQELVPRVECDAFSGISVLSQLLEPNQITEYPITAQVEGEPGDYSCSVEIKNLGSASFVVLIK